MVSREGRKKGGEGGRGGKQGREGRREGMFVDE